MQRRKWSLQQHSLSLAALCIVVILIGLYSRSNPDTHTGSFYGNAIADWSGVLLTIIATKYLYEKGSAESRKMRKIKCSPAEEFFREHSLTIFLLITGAGWTWAFLRMSPTSKWGQVVGNIVSEWTQVLGLVLMTKRLIEVNSKESNKPADSRSMHL